MGPSPNGRAVRRRCPVLPDQLVGAVVLVGDGGRPPGDRGYVPVVVVSVGIGCVAAVLIADQQRLGTIDINQSRQKNRPLNSVLSRQRMLCR